MYSVQNRFCSVVLIAKLKVQSEIEWMIKSEEEFPKLIQFED